ncbi:C-type lectin lectoxin-Thr1-like, partial [Astyanax mexicanus]
FVYYTDQKTWMEAQDFCRQSHTDLACPINLIENTFVQTVAPYGMNWIGFFRDAWKWSDQTNNSAIKWSSGNPNNAGGKDNCGYVVKSMFSSSYNPWNFFYFGFRGTTDVYSGGWFDDGDCSVQRAFFCQSLPTPKKRQVMRVVVQSDQDMNDPTVKAALLVKIQQKLKEQGMTENPTLRWKEQSDGSVFYKQKEKRRENMENNTTRVCEL